MVDGIAVSEEYPNVRNLYYSTGGSLGRFDISQNLPSALTFSQAGALSFGIAVTPGRAPSRIFAFNGGQTVEVNQQMRPIFLRVTEDSGRPVSNARITLTSSVPGVTLIPEAPVTNQFGVAAFVAIAPSVAGAFTIRAQAIDGGIGNGPVVNIETTVRGTGGGGGGGGGLGGMTRWAGDGQIMQLGVFSDPITVRLVG